MTTARREDRVDWRLLLALYVLIAGAFIARAILNLKAIPLLNDTDDAMRLVMVHDFLAGQGWYDLVQHRLDTPFGASMHWSRLVDLPEATLIAALRPFAGGLADTIAAFAWPLGLLLVMLWLYARLALRLVGRDGLLAALALPAFSLVTMAEFAPGRFDHHSVQIVLLLATLLCTINALERPRQAIGAGIAAATALAIGIESLPTVAAAVLAFGLAWGVSARQATALRNFGLSFAGAALVHLAIALPPERWFMQACDSLSLVYVAMAVGVGAAFLLLSLLPLGNRPAWVRLAVGAGAGVVLLVLLYAAFPACFRGPYSSLDPWLLTHWIDRISEAQPIWVSLAGDPTYGIAVGVPVLLAIAAVAVRVWRGPAEGRGAWLVYGLFLLLTFVVMVLQIRGCRLATSLALPAGAWVISAVRARYVASRRAGWVLALVGSWIAFAGLGLAILTNLVIMAFPDYEASLADPEAAARNACRQPASFAALATMPAARAMTPIDLGAHMLLFTPHAVVSAPYHRDVDGLLDTFAFFNGPIEAGRAILEARGITLVVTCPALPELHGTGEVAPDSFIRLSEKHALPAWLTDISGPASPLRVYAVVPRP